jgi:hypothetical protein
MVALTGLMVGCMSYKGQYDASIPVQEQSILKIQSELTVVNFDGTPQPWSQSADVVLIPSGTHTMVANYYNRVTTGSSRSGDYVTTYYQTTTAEGLELTYEFQAGHSYTISASENRDNTVSARITENSEGSPGDTSTALMGPKYTEAGLFITPDFKFGSYLNWLGVGVMVEEGVFVEGKFPMAVYVDLGFGYSLFPSYFDIPIGVFGEIYPLNKGNMGFGLGAGFNVGYLGPYIRAAFIPFHKKSKLRGYVEVNFFPKPRYMMGTEEEPSAVGLKVGAELFLD